MRRSDYLNRSLRAGESAMATSRSMTANRRKSASTGTAGRKAVTGVVKAEHKRKVVKKPSAEKSGRSDRKEPYPVKQTRK